MWRCKECGSKDDFIEEILSGTEWRRYDEYGTICNRCGNRGKNIQDIADWI